MLELWLSAAPGVDMDRINQFNFCFTTPDGIIQPYVKPVVYDAYVIIPDGAGSAVRDYPDSHAGMCVKGA